MLIYPIIWLDLKPQIIVIFLPLGYKILWILPEISLYFSPCFLYNLCLSNARWVR